jgi:UDP-glucose 4-epimerase
LSGEISNVLVTGGCGFIGGHLVKTFVEKGWQVGVLDNLSTGEIANLPAGRKVSFHHIDIRDFDSVRKAMNGYDAVVHEAALVSVTRSTEDPLTTSAVNVGGTLNLLVAAKDTGVKRFVYASSSSVYGDTEILPKVETMESKPASPYAVSKLAAEKYCGVFANVYGLKTVSLRYFNVYGPCQKPGPYSGVIPTFINRVIADKPPVICGDGLQTRDFTFVKDVVQANLLCLEKPIKGGEIFNIGSNRRTSLNQLAQLICSLAGKEGIKQVYGPARPGDVKHSYADISKISSTLGYKPMWPLESGLKEVFAWLRSNPAGSNSFPSSK